MRNPVVSTRTIPASAIFEVDVSPVLRLFSVYMEVLQLGHTRHSWPLLPRTRSGGCVRKPCAFG